MPAEQIRANLGQANRGTLVHQRGTGSVPVSIFRRADVTAGKKRESIEGRILIVEDSRTQAEYLSHLVTNGGYRVVVASDGKKALEVMQHERPALVLTDIVMPEMDGYQLCEAIKANDITRSIPVILVTQLYDPSDVLKGLESGADNFIVKPYDPEQVYSRIAVTLESTGRSDPDGAQEPIDIEFAGTPHRIASGRLKILNILLSTYDFAVRKNAELQDAHEHVSALNEELTSSVEELQHANKRLSQENAERSRVEKALADANRKLNLMTSITRHDINNQTLALQAYIDLSEAAVTDPTVLQYIRKLRLVANTIQKQISFTKEYEDIGIHAPVWQDLQALTEPLHTFLKGTGITLKNRDLGYEVYADPLLSKVFENLIDNSLRHGKNVQHIMISTVAGEKGERILRYQDDGDGISDEDKKKIFQKGFGKNTGLGLFLSREILEITGIVIRETGIAGRGVQFDMHIPPEGFRSLQGTA